MSQTMFMFDDTNVALDPANAYAYAGYVDGAFVNFSELQRRFPNAHLLSITAFGNKASCFDVEPGDGTNAEVYGWFTAMEKDGVWRPCVYTSASNAYAMQVTMRANGFARSSYRLWTAHYTGVPHFCSPNTCGYGLDQADGTQFTDRALGRSLDESIIADDFFPSVPTLNPVSGLHVTHRGWTSISLAWNAPPGATSFTVHTYWRNQLVQTDAVSSPSIRVGGLVGSIPHTYTFRVRAHPGGSTGSDASIKATTR